MSNLYMGMKIPSQRNKGSHGNLEEGEYPGD